MYIFCVYMYISVFHMYTYKCMHIWGYDGIIINMVFCTSAFSLKISCEHFLILLNTLLNSNF